MGDDKIQIIPPKVFSSEDCTNAIILSMLDVNRDFSNLCILKGEETLGDGYEDSSIAISLPSLEHIDGTLFKSFDTISVDFPKLSYAKSVFGGDVTTTILGDYPSLFYQENMCTNMISLYEFKGSLPKLLIGDNMFSGCSSLKIFVGSLTNLISGVGMFENTNLDVESLYQIDKTLGDINEVKAVYTDGIEIQFHVMNLVDNVPTYEVVNKTMTLDEIGKITISWANLDNLTMNDKATILHEIFPSMEKKGWVITTNLSEIYEEDSVLDDDSYVEEEN